ncbi:hypothetical protein BC940DRAFT_290217 [Gongronella butleri]|nr:hypothetical protein BC940DRAFT_290217 [Gongronella butleri]
MGVMLNFGVDNRPKIHVVREDITALQVNAIVNPTNKELIEMNGTLSGIIVQAGGPLLQNDLRTRSKIKLGEAITTPSYNLLKANAVIHTAVPHRTQGPALLEECYKNSLRQLVMHGYHSIAFPCIGTGIQGYDHFQAAQIAFATVKNFLENDISGASISEVVFCTYQPHDYEAYRQLLPRYFPC